jgi:4'-phosphopantetheinyl transferase
MMAASVIARPPTPFGAGAIHVWLSDLSATSEAPPEDCRLLDAEERVRADRFHFPVDRARWIRAHAMLRRLIGAYLGVPPVVLTFAEDRNGKPHLTGRGAGALHFNLSHSGDRAALALATDRPVGVDIEAIRPLDDPDFAARVLSPAELDMWRRLDDEARGPALVRTWSAKEAYAKAQGLGLGLDFRTVESTLGMAAQIIAADGTPWQLHRLDGGPCHTLAVAAPGVGLAVETFIL